VILFGVALWKKDDGVKKYGLALSIFGTAVAAYQTLLQYGIVPSLLCSTGDLSTSCAQRFILSFGYLTIPLMSLSTFALLIALAAPKRRP